jgi:DNA-binding CsgD family transcriptional regulator
VSVSRRSRRDGQRAAARIDLIGEIYQAVGDIALWAQLTRRLAGMPVTPEIEYHLAAARRAHERHVLLADEVTALSAVHDQLALGALLVDQDARVARGNAISMRLLADAAGLVLVDGRVELADPGDDGTLRTAIGETARTGRRCTAPFVLARQPDRSPLLLFVLPARDASQQPFFDDRLAVLLVIVDPEINSAAGPQVLRAIFGFTAREAECAGLLMQGCTIGDAAHALGVTRNTARTFLAHMAAKTDSHSQTELIRLLLAIPALVVSR